MMIKYYQPCIEIKHCTTKPLFSNYIFIFSWLCVRSQCQDNSSKESRAIVTLPNPDTALSWCQGADEWDENDNDTANGNFMNVDNAPSPNNAVQR